ncbi:hypothetical protein N3K66_007241 [Trichothecium roseum]|uniref:Uncharacterized protein n=1 Tax=Trichothecium roseum TaxID=47278 RepID=A0ACC0UTH6_9HYPO|nr:hypothetical protein N3K66_007241 [Trichothecium roseum]
MLPSVVPSLEPLPEEGQGSLDGDNQEPSFGDLASVSPSAHANFEFPFQDKRTALYLLHHVREIAPRIDICDQARNFAIEVPKRAFRSPLLAFSILAFSSRDWCSLKGVDDAWSDAYYSRALQILIPVLDDPIELLDENVLAAIVLLRLHEEMSDMDTGTHLLGSTRLLNSASTFASQGGIGEAASWIVLRQCLYLSITRSQPLRINLGNYKASAAFRDSEPESMANRIILLCAQILTPAVDARQGLDAGTWGDLGRDVDMWRGEVDWPFAPDEDGVGDDGEGVPDLWVALPVHAIGFQHYYLARLLLAVFDPQLWEPGHKALLSRVDAETLICRNLMMVVALAISNPGGSSLGMTAHHALYAYGALLYDSKQQRSVLGFLSMLSERTGWRTKPLVEKLRGEWDRRARRAGY